MRQGRADLLDRLERHRLLLGLGIIAVGAIVFAISWGASRGLPWKDYRHVDVLVPDAAQLVVGDEVREGGRRIGRVREIAAAAAGDRIVARLALQLDPDQAAVPVDSTVRVAPVNVFGNKVVELERGRSATTVAPDGTLPLDRARVGVELSDVLADTDATLGRRVRDVVAELGPGLAGRGPDLGRAIAATRVLLPRAERVATLLADPATRLEPLLARLDDLSGVLARIAVPLTAAMGDGARVLGALDAAGPALERTIADAPAALGDTTGALRTVRPLLADLRVVAERLRPAAARLPRTVAGGERVVDRADGLLDPGTGLVGAVRRLATIATTTAGARPGIERVLADLRLTNEPLGQAVRAIGDAEVHCGVGGLLARNLTGAVATGDRAGAWLTGQFLLLDPTQLVNAATPSPELHVDPQPRIGADGCDLANERYRPGRQTGRVPSDRYVVRNRPPAEVLERARRAGLLDDFERRADR
jgi:ABC-type transporter Mla subunit MlaD